MTNPSTMSIIDKKQDAWLKVCRARGWPHDVISAFFYDHLYDEDVTYAFNEMLLICKPRSDMHFARFKEWNHRYPEYTVDILRV